MRKVVLSLVVGLVLVTASCAQQAEEPSAEQSISLGDVAESVEGNVVTIPVTVRGLEIVKADGDTSGESGHFHVFVDQDMPDVGEIIPTGRPGIIHTAENPIKVYGLTPGEHMFHIVVGDGTHKRFGEELHLETMVDVEGPSVDGKAPVSIDEGDDLKVDLSAEDVEIVKADGDESGETGHFHVIVDPATPPQAGKVIPAAQSGSPYAEQVIHTFESSATVSDLATGEHTIWVVLGDGAHRAFEPAVMDKLTVTVA
jgi:hypothetical protein